MTYIDYEEEEGIGYSMVIRTSMIGLVCWKCGAEVKPKVEHRCGALEPKIANPVRKRRAVSK